MKKTLIKRKAIFSKKTIDLLDQLQELHEAPLSEKVFDYLPNTLRTKVNRYLKPYDSHTSHDFRHTRITELAVSGLSVKTMQVLVGHANPSTTMRYIHTDQDQALQQVKQY
jgi:integrase